jgi:hypothetical protein
VFSATSSPIGFTASDLEARFLAQHVTGHEAAERLDLVSFENPSRELRSMADKSDSGRLVPWYVKPCTTEG